MDVKKRKLLKSKRINTFEINVIKIIKNIKTFLP
jgi:hypothetical protein